MGENFWVSGDEREDRGRRPRFSDKGRGEGVTNNTPAPAFPGDAGGRSSGERRERIAQRRGV